MAKIEIIRGDAFELIREVKDSSIDLVFTDPPYRRAAQVKLESLTGEQMRTMSKEFARVLKRTGNLVLFCGMYDKWMWYNYLTEARLKYVMELLWVYRNPSTIRFQKRKFVPAHDTIFLKDENGEIKLSGIDKATNSVICAFDEEGNENEM